VVVSRLRTGGAPCGEERVPCSQRQGKCRPWAREGARPEKLGRSASGIGASSLYLPGGSGNRSLETSSLQPTLSAIQSVGAETPRLSPAASQENSAIPRGSWRLALDRSLPETAQFVGERVRGRPSSLRAIRSVGIRLTIALPETPRVLVPTAALELGRGVDWRSNSRTVPRHGSA